MNDTCITCGQVHPPNPLKNLLSYAEKVALLGEVKIRINTADIATPLPPVHTYLWEDEDWVAWVDAHGTWPT